MMVAQQNKRAIGAFSDRAKAEIALRELKDSGFSMDRVSVVGHDINHNTSMSGAEVSDRVSSNLGEGNKLEAGAATGVATGVAVGGITGLLVGLGMVAIPGVGPIMLAGAAATTLATALTGGAIGATAGGFVGALVGMGIPEDIAKTYSDRLDRGDYLVMVEGSEEDIERSHAILHHRGISHWGVYDDNRDVRTNHSVITGDPNL